MPAAPPHTTPRALRPRQCKASSSNGKLAEAAMAKARPIITAMFSCWNRVDSSIAARPRPSVASRETLSSLRGSAGLFQPAGVQVVADRAGAGQHQAGHHRQDGGEGHRRHQRAREIAAQQSGQVQRRHIAAADQLAVDRMELRVGPTRVIAP
ncbi:Uncharacterised protein [Chromobacterium violaceum]|uniref:Uncharacterized protein n=1 Tax=Chromobacterium violaceum TaxID=536 RepID=A0A447T7M3_CHRVL|nr:Uncharacterised protein [Chromobacterium violaceum]